MKEFFTNKISWNQKCWRYFKLDRFISSIHHGHMYFAAANQFEDKFEGAVSLQHPISTHYLFSSPIINLANEAFRELQRLTKVNCWHKAEYESDMMWKLYAQQMKGVAICSTPEKMKKSFKPFKLKPEYSQEKLYIGNVEYIDLTSFRIDATMESIFFYKHLAYSLENELRLAIFLRLAEEFGVSVPEKGIFVQVNFEELIDRIVIGPNINSKEKDGLYQVCKEYGLEAKLQDSSLIFTPLFI